MPKPFGKPIRSRWDLTKGLRLTIALWGAAIPAFFLCGLASRSFPTLARRPFFWPAAVGFALLYALSIALWLRRRPSPRGPAVSSRAKIFLARLLLAILIAAPTGLASAWLYGPAFTLANGLVPGGGTRTEYAMVDRHQGLFVLDSPYWEPGFRWEISHSGFIPPDLTPGSLAKLSLRRGLLGARWVEKIEYELLR